MIGGREALADRRYIKELGEATPSLSSIKARGRWVDGDLPSNHSKSSGDDG